ncbi:MAG: leucine-rich repeat protein [Muribaculaceae bacterium]|nr:leucine-rich repeat protein [Muribaculaceae bacterium]
MKQKLICLLVALFSSAAVYAYDFEVDGIYYNINGSEATVTYKDYGSYSGSVVIPKRVTYNGTTYSVTTIGNNAFDGCVSLKSVTIPEGVNVIGNNAFNYCDSLKSVTIPEGVTAIGENAFSCCNSLTSVTIPTTITSIENYVFDCCSGLISITIPESVSTIGKFAFACCTSLITMNIPESVTSIGMGAFSYCCNLTSITIPEGITVIEESTFSDCFNLTSINIPDNVNTIGKYAFCGCSKMASVTIGKSVTSIGERAFWYCDGLKAFYGKYASDDNRCLINDGTLIAFAPSEITSYNIPESVITIGERAFENSDYLTSVTIPSSIISIGDKAFYNCSKLKTVTNHSSLDIVQGATTHGYVAYYANEVIQITGADYVILNKTSLTLNVGETATLTATILPENTTDKTLTWTSSDEAVATVDGNGKITAIDAGTAIITATCGSASKQCEVNVNYPQTQNGFVIEDADLHIGKTLLLPVKLNNEASIVSFNCDVELPEGLTLAKDEYGDYDITLADRTDNTHTILSSDLDGKVRVVEYSSKNHPFSGNEGTIFYLPVTTTDAAAAGDELTVKITGIRLTKECTFEKLISPDAMATLSIKPAYTPGDLNDDGEYDAADISIEVEFVLGHTPEHAVVEAADLDGDSEITAADISIVVSYVLSGKVIDAAGSARIKSNSVEPASERLSYCGAEANWAKIGLTNAGNYTAAQFDIVLPEGVTVADVRMADQNGSHCVMFNEYNPGTVRVLAYSSMNANFVDGQSFIELQLNGFGDGDMVITNAKVVRKDGDSITELPAEGCVITGAISDINGVGSDELMISVENCNIVITAPEATTVRFSDTLGRSSVISIKAGRNVIPVVPGIYFINNKKIVIR